MIYLIILSITILILIDLLLLFSLKRLNIRSKNESNEVNISIVIAAKNEAENINELINQLRKLDYPPEMFEVIFVDHSSTDGTLIKMKEQTASFKNFSV
ncbi:MAG: glycosyltransferase, partial [Ignavibacteria bacterium]|nr:glycosyltransferase [Ignavibacteria bacterium]